MINVREAFASVRHKYPKEVIAEAIRLDNGYFFFTKGNELGAAGIFVDQNTGEAEYAPLSFLVSHDTLANNEVDISRFQSPEESVERHKR